VSRRRWLVKSLADLLNVDITPVERIHELQDDPRKMYLWQMDCTDKQCVKLTEKINSEFVQKYSQDPEALHLIRNDVKSVTELDPDIIREQLQPWLDN